MQMKTNIFSLKKRDVSLSCSTDKWLGNVTVGLKRMNVTGDEHELI